jgi:tetratricopeptide (TPR) repeat protein
MTDLKDNKACNLILLIIFALMTTQCLADDGKAYLERGIKAYSKDADFDKAISELKKAIEFGLSEVSDMVKAHLYLGFAYMANNKRIDAVVEFAKAINLDPELTLDPKIYSLKIISAFNETKASLVDTLTVISNPGGAKVYLDNKRVGVTPLKLNNVITGDHNLTISKDYFLSKTLDIKVYKGEDNRIEVELEKADITININSNPSEAIVYISGNPEGKTPISLKISLDKDINLKLAKEEYLDREINVKLSNEGIVIHGIDKVFSVKDNIADVQIDLVSAPAPGSLKIISEPQGALVYLDGIEKGQTPLILTKITPGNREVRVSIPEFDTISKRIDIISNKEALADFVLGGTVKLLSIPSNARVFINGKLAGNTPLNTNRLPIGSHQVRFSKDKYSDKTITVLIERGQEKEIKVRLLEKKGSLAISSDPSDADVYLNDELKGKTPFFLYGLPIGEYSVRLSKAGFDDWNGKVNVKENELSWVFGKLVNQ